MQHYDGYHWFCVSIARNAVAFVRTGQPNRPVRQCTTSVLPNRENCAWPNCTSIKNMASLGRNSFQFGSTNTGPASSHKYQDVLTVKLYTVKLSVGFFFQSHVCYLSHGLSLLSFLFVYLCLKLSIRGLWLENETVDDTTQTLPVTLMTIQATGQRDHYKERCRRASWIVL